MEQQPLRTDGGSSDGEDLDLLEARYGSRFLRDEAPAETLPAVGMSSVDAVRLVSEELLIDGSPMRNLATFVTTWMEPEAQRLIARQPAPQLHRSRRVSADGGARAALHPDAGRPVPRSRGDDRGANAGIV